MYSFYLFVRIAEVLDKGVAFLDGLLQCRHFILFEMREFAHQLGKLRYRLGIGYLQREPGLTVLRLPEREVVGSDGVAAYLDY